MSLTSIPCKIMEYFIRNCIIDHMRSQNLFSEFQFVFVSNRSTTLQLLHAMETWTKSIDSGQVIDNCYLDIQKAFDTVPHKRLMMKLEAYGIKGKILDWIRSFLSNREQCVKVNGTISDTSEVSSGVPQGSVLGPTLFVIYINDLPESVQSNILLYADDSKLFRAVRGYEDTQMFQQDLSAMEEWSKKWLLKFHPEKCHMMRIGLKEQEKAEYIMHSEGNSIKLQWSESERDLGVMVDGQLKFQTEIQSRKKKGNTID